MLMRTDPFRTWDRFFDTVGTPAGVQTPTMDAYRVGDVVTVDFDLPGVDPETIDLQVERGELRLNARRRHQVPEGATFMVQERRNVTLSRRVMLGETLDVNHVDAEYHDGVLTLRIPLSETAKPRQVEVRHSAGSDSPALEVESS